MFNCDGDQPCKHLLLVALAGSVMLGVTRGWLDHSVGNVEDRNEVLTRMQLIERPVENVVLKEPAPNPESARAG